MRSRALTIAHEDTREIYKQQYWDALPRVTQYICENLTGDKSKTWGEDFKERYGQKPFERGLVLNCGNGWVDRAFVDRNIVKRVVAFDFSRELLEIAEREKGNRPISYFRADVNQIDFAPDQFDLIINVAALHHVQYINRLCRILSETLKKDGIFVNYDYIGPHRNQYSFRQWWYVNRFNRTLPEYARNPSIRYPHLPTMLYYDPTEAIHSELIIESVLRYFQIIERHDTGGGIAYHIFSFNPNVLQVPPEQLDLHVGRILALDKQYTAEGKVPPLFSYFIARPNKGALANRRRLEYFQQIEDRREIQARKRRGVYSNRHYVRMIVHSLYVKCVNVRSARVFRWIKQRWRIWRDRREGGHAGGASA